MVQEVIKPKWYRVLAHDYYDESPHISYKLFDSSKHAKEYENHMNLNYSGGTTKVESGVTKEEILNYAECMELDELTISNINNDEYY